jgi:hypothetical protein
MPKNQTHSQVENRRPRRERRISLRTELRRQPDLQKIAHAVVALAMAQAEKEAQAEASLFEPQEQDDHE